MIKNTLFIIGNTRFFKNVFYQGLLKKNYRLMQVSIKGQKLTMSKSMSDIPFGGEGGGVVSL